MAASGPAAEEAAGPAAAGAGSHSTRIARTPSSAAAARRVTGRRR